MAGHPPGPTPQPITNQDVQEALYRSKVGQIEEDKDPLRKEPLKRKLHFCEHPKDKHITGTLRKDIDAVSLSEPLTPEVKRKMENNIFVNLRSQFPRLSRRELRAEARRRLNEEVKRRKLEENAKNNPGK